MNECMIRHWRNKNENKNKNKKLKRSVKEISIDAKSLFVYGCVQLRKWKGKGKGNAWFDSIREEERNSPN